MIPRNLAINSKTFIIKNDEKIDDREFGKMAEIVLVGQLPKMKN